jgi:type II secretory pathway pseudopilin PulG
MFSLIITIISIALVAALAVATIYYGGPAFQNNGTRAAAVKVVNAGQQINGAVEMYKAQKGDVPATLDDLVTSNLLKSIPAGTWAMQNDYIVATGISELQCLEANRQLGRTETVVPACSEPTLVGVTACCSTPDAG